MRECVLSVDVGTTALKAVLLAPDGTALGVSERAYARGTTRGDSGLSGAMEQDPNEWLEAFARAARDVLAPFGDAKPAGIALSGQMQNVVLARAGASLRPCLLYSDVRAVEEAERIRRRLRSDDVRDDAAFPLANFKGAAACLCKWLWLSRHDAETLAEAETLLLGAHSFLAYALCGGDRSAAACDATTASTTGLLAAGEGSARWAKEACGLFPGVDPALLPPLLRGFAPPPVGEGLQKSRGENAAAAEPRARARVPRRRRSGEHHRRRGGRRRRRRRELRVLRHVGVGRARASAGRKNGKNGNGNRLFAHDVHVAPPRPETGDRGGVDGDRRRERGVGAPVFAIPNRKGGDAAAREATPKDFDAAAAAAPPGSDGVLFLPHLNGERSPFTDATARGCFVNLSPATTAGHACRAVPEGVAYNYRSLADAVAAPNDEGLSALCPMPFLGGGANSPLWTQIIADATRRPLAPLPDASTVAARGCAAGAFEFLGLWGPISGNDHDFGESEGGGRAKPPAGYFPRRGGGEGDAFAPDADAAATHDKNYAVWCKLHDALAGAGAGSLV